MTTLPPVIMELMVPFAPLFRKPTWEKAVTLVIGAILTPGRRTVTAALRVMGLADDVNFAKYQSLFGDWEIRDKLRAGGENVK
jgi:hypothetical protein